MKHDTQVEDVTAYVLGRIGRLREWQVQQGEGEQLFYQTTRGRTASLAIAELEDVLNVIIDVRDGVYEGGA